MSNLKLSICRGPESEVHGNGIEGFTWEWDKNVRLGMRLASRKWDKRFHTANSSRDDKLSERVKKFRKKKTGPSWGLNPGPSEY